MSDECGIGATALGIRPRTTPTCRSRRPRQAVTTLYTA